MLRDHERIAREMNDPALVRLHRKLERLSSVLTVMNTGAHPDDEASGMLAFFRYGLGMRVVIACSTRGEGGQNAIGSERGAALGVLRTREMEVAARILDADVAWLGHGPDDPVHDFGFSKNGDDTLARWGEDRIVERLVRAYRQEKPDIVIPTFLDVPGQHGHHRAMTRAAEIALERAADPRAYPHHLTEGLKPWRVSKFYLPAWSGGGGTYDDEVPPPITTLIVEAPAEDGATGAPFARIGEWSRAGHLSQGMGAWLDSPPRSWPLHLLKALSGNVRNESDIREGLAASVGALADIEGLPQAVAAHLLGAQDAINEVHAAFPNRQRILDAALRAAADMEAALAGCPDSLRDRLGHRLQRKIRELDAVILEARGIHVRAWADPTVVVPGSRTILHVALEGPADALSARPVAGPHLSVAEDNRSGDRIRFGLAAEKDAPLTNPYPPHYRALGGNGEVSIALEAEIGGRKTRSLVDLEEPLRIVPNGSLVLDPDAVIVDLSETPKTFHAKAYLEDDIAQNGLAFAAPSGWRVIPDSAGIRVELPTKLEAGLYRIEPSVTGQPAYRSRSISYPHIGRTAHVSRETLKILALDVLRSPNARIGYVGGGNDRVGLWLARLGYDVTDLDAEGLQGDLSRFTTIVIGIFAFGTRPDLAAARARLHDFVEKGGHLVTLYHRPSDGWDVDSTPPRPIEIGSPSLRWRVTDPQAPVTVLEPDHTLLAGPNRIGAEDWNGWDKERGLYFASCWDKAYTPLLAMSDKGEKPLTGGLISGRIGRGRHTHVSLVLHHQLDRLIPGAFRILANLVQPA